MNCNAVKLMAAQLALDIHQTLVIAGVAVLCAVFVAADMVDQ